MENIEAMLCAYVEGELDETGRAEIEKHLQQNPQHRKLIAELMRTRDLVRDLPRVSAPSETGESLRRQVERLILLDDADSDATGPLAHQVRRWPGVLAVAAILLLCTSLGLIVYKTVGPAFRPAVVTQVTPMKPADVQTKDEELRSNSALAMNTPIPAPGASAPVAGAPPSDRAMGASPTVLGGAMDDHGRRGGGFGGGGGAGGFGGAGRFGSVSPDSLDKSGKLDLPAVRRVLLGSGYDLPQPATNNSAPVVLLVNTSDPALTNTLVAHFLNTSNNGIFWTFIPSQPWLDQSQRGDQNQNFSNNAYKALPAPLQQQQTPANNSMENSQPQQMLQQMQLQILAPDTAHALAPKQTQSQVQMNDQPQPAAPTTEPSGVMYLAKGMTRQQADELQRSLSDTGQSTQFVETAAEAPTTQAAGTATLAESGAKAAPATQPQTPDANNNDAGAAAPSPLTSTAAVPISPPPADNNGNNVTAPVVIDALIVVQSAGAQEATPTSRPAPQANPASQPANQ